MRNNLMALAVAATALCCAVSAHSADRAYDATLGGDFGVVDLKNGVFTLRGNSGVQLTGLAVGADGALYSGRYHGTEFYRVNPLNGSLTTIGHSGGMTYIDIGSTLSGVYGLGDDEYLYSIDTGTGAATQIGYAGFWPTILGMSTGSADLYIAWQSNTSGNDYLYRMNTANASTPLVGYTGVAFGALVTTGGTLYGGVDPGNAVYAVNPATGAFTFKANVTGTTREFFGLAPISAAEAAGVPETASWTLMIVGFGAAGAMLRRRRATTLAV